MGKEYTRTLNNSNVEKKLSKKLSKKNSKKNYNSKSKKNANKNKDTNTSEEMLKILNSDTDVMYQSKNNNLPNNNLQNNNLIPYNGDLPQQYVTMNQQQMNQQQITNIGTNLPSDFDATMIHQMAPLQNKEMFTNLHNLSRGPDISMSNNNFNSVSMPQDQGNNTNFSNLNMLGTTKI